MEKKIDIQSRFHREINEIQYIIDNIRNGRIYGYQGNPSKMDGSPAKIADNLEKEFYDLINKIEYGKLSASEDLAHKLHNINK